jgi:vacuolar-type H+-ATPase subunit C/Vma6
MGDYDYLNARVRAMGTALLERDFYERALAAEDEEALVEALLESPYGPQLREAMDLLPAREAVDSALKRNLHATFGGVRWMAPARPRQLLNVQFNQWDAANVLAILRGKVNQVEARDIVRGLVPMGEFTEVQLAELADESDALSVANALTTWGYPFAFQLRRVIRDHLEALELVALESAVNRLYFRWGLEQLQEEDGNTRMARHMLQLQIDLANIRAALDHVRHRDKGEEMEGFQLIPGGTIRREVLHEAAAAQGSLAAFEMLAETRFAPAIEKGILAFGGARRLGVMERFLEQEVIEAGCRLYRRDPLSLAVPLGFVWRKYNEFVNLRILVRGKAYRMPVNAVREELLFL